MIKFGSLNGVTFLFLNPSMNSSLGKWTFEALKVVFTINLKFRATEISDNGLEKKIKYFNLGAR